MNLSALAIVVRGTQWPGYSGAPLPSVRLKVALAGQQMVELLNLLAAAPGWTRDAVARAVCSFDREAVVESKGRSPSSPPSTCAGPTAGSFAGLDLNALNYSAYSAQQLGSLRLRVLSTVLAAQAQQKPHLPNAGS